MKYALIAAAALLAACSAPETQESTAGAEPTHGTYLKDSYAEVPLDQYLRIKDALVSSNPAEAQAAAKHLDSLWTTNSPGDQLLSSVRQIASTSDLAAQREAFYSLTQAYLVSLESKPGEDTLYLQFCPMAFDFEGATWISREKVVMNPYFGDEMLNCGVVRKPIVVGSN
ncbi:MAG: hypothetical protein ABR83_03460 [Cryomorphaceae bacterium BACL18 MAG-120924-bin36]|jgi:hypothetical protein|nr:MAG: hypothetical protein ABR83_03460 [Cryomorphaceae bacterium BACL18 MAG-120924-bin36]MDP5014521.1 DUF3347 domain-containing protein [Schleiferiaceae bacterium]